MSLAPDCRDYIFFCYCYCDSSVCGSSNGASESPSALPSPPVSAILSLHPPPPPSPKRKNKILCAYTSGENQTKPVVTYSIYHQEMENLENVPRADMTSFMCGALPCYKEPLFRVVLMFAVIKLILHNVTRVTCIAVVLFVFASLHLLSRFSMAAYGDGSPSPQGFPLSPGSPPTRAVTNSQGGSAPCSTLFVANLGPYATEQELREVFSQ